MKIWSESQAGPQDMYCGTSWNRERGGDFPDCLSSDPVQPVDSPPDVISFSNVDSPEVDIHLKLSTH